MIERISPRAQLTRAFHHRAPRSNAAYASDLWAGGTHLPVHAFGGQASKDYGALRRRRLGVESLTGGRGERLRPVMRGVLPASLAGSADRLSGTSGRRCGQDRARLERAGKQVGIRNRIRGQAGVSERYAVQEAGGRAHLGHWIPAEAMDQFNAMFVGTSEITKRFPWPTAFPDVLAGTMMHACSPAANILAKGVQSDLTRTVAAVSKAPPGAFPFHSEWQRSSISCLSASSPGKPPRAFPENELENKVLIPPAWDPSFDGPYAAGWTDFTLPLVSTTQLNLRPPASRSTL